jgi:hypothetical protein
MGSPLNRKTVSENTELEFRWCNTFDISQILEHFNVSKLSYEKLLFLMGINGIGQILAEALPPDANFLQFS